MEEIIITKEQQDVILKALQKKAGKYECSLCHKGNGNIEPYLINLPVSGYFSIQTKGKILPLVPVVCMNCGNTNFVNTNILGLTDIFKKKNKVY